MSENRKLFLNNRPNRVLIFLVHKLLRMVVFCIKLLLLLLLSDYKNRNKENKKNVSAIYTF